MWPLRKDPTADPDSGPVLVSACLAGRACAYDGEHRAAHRVLELVREGRAVLVCPEHEGGLPVPRPPAEIIGGTGEDVLDGRAQVLTVGGADVTGAYVAGARIAVERAAAHGCQTAILKARSPSCGCGQIFDGSFTRTPRSGNGVAAAALLRAGLHVITDEAQRWLYEQLGSEKVDMALSQMEGYDEVMQKLLAKLPPEQRVAGLSPEQRMAGLPPEQRVAGLPPEQVLHVYSAEEILPALPDEILRLLPDEAIDKLPEPTRSAVRARLGR